MAATVTANPLAYDDWKLCNCARCDEELLGESMQGVDLDRRHPRPQFVAERIDERPVCKRCSEKIRARTAGVR